MSVPGKKDREAFFFFENQVENSSFFFLYRNEKGGHEQDGWLPFLDLHNLKILFDRHDADGNENVDKREMLL